MLSCVITWPWSRPKDLSFPPDLSIVSSWHCLISLTNLRDPCRTTAFIQWLNYAQVESISKLGNKVFYSYRRSFFLENNLKTMCHFTLTSHLCLFFVRLNPNKIFVQLQICIKSFLHSLVSGWFIQELCVQNKLWTVHIMKQNGTRQARSLPEAWPWTWSLTRFYTFSKIRYWICLMPLKETSCIHSRREDRLNQSLGTNPSSSFLLLDMFRCQSII